jgi:hypothetical protein
MTDRYAVINPETLKAMRHAGHVAKLEARIEKLEAALRKLSGTCDCWAAVEECEKARKLLEEKDD